MNEFHFLRPEWLLLLPVALVIAWLYCKPKSGGDWERVMDSHLLSFLSASENSNRLPRQVWLWTAAWVLALLALAGPSWKQLQTPVLKKSLARVIVLDLSHSMNAEDVTPNRLERAKFKLLDLLSRFREGETALVVYAGTAHTVAPLTPDVRTISNLVPVLNPELMPVPGSRPELGLKLASEMLQTKRAGRSTIYWITDGMNESLVQSVLNAAESHRLAVLAVGSEPGAPIPTSTGEFIKDRKGRIVVPQLNMSVMETVASSTGGGVVRMRHDDADIDAMLTLESRISGYDQHEENTRTDRFQDEGIWLALLVLPFAALLFRRGTVWCLLLCGLALQPLPAHAFKWRDLWQRPDQQGEELFRQGNSEAAVDTFTHPEWKGVSSYRAGDYRRTAKLLEDINNPRAHYNRGNALARSGDLKGALEAYGRALTLNPEMDDAGFNREIVRKLLEQQQDQETKKSQQSDQPDAQDSPESQSGQQALDSRQKAESNNSKKGNENRQSSSSQNAEKDPSAVSDQKEPGSQANEDSTNTAEPDVSQKREAEHAVESKFDEFERTDERRQNGNLSQKPMSPVDLTPEQQQLEQTLRKVPDNPGRLLRNKFLLNRKRQGISGQKNVEEYW